VVHAVTSWLPVYQAGEAVGWTLDMMRRRPDRGNGLMEFLIASAALRFKEEGAQFLSLSGAPLAHHAPRPRSSVPQRLLDRIGRAIEPVYGFGSLLAFKAKFQPVYRPLMLAYPESAVLPGIAVAIARAYLPALTPRQAVQLIRLSLHRTGSRRSQPGGGTAPGQTPAIPPAGDLPGMAVAPPAVPPAHRHGPVLAGSGPGLPEGG
jgi:phosphatidylglycerol lysyltransferase